jgi:hypothetical protein
MTDSKLRDYLLRRLPEAEAQQLEERMLDDDELFMTLRSVEDDLVDAVARGELDDDARAAFEQRYRGQPSRVRFARALARRSANVVPFGRRRWIAFAVAAAVVVISSALLVTRKEPSHAVVSTPVAIVKAPPSIVYPVVLSLAASRSAGAANTITLPREATTLRLQVRLDRADQYDRYRAALQSSRGIVWQAENLKAAPEGDALLLTADVPASALLNDSYELAVHGGADDLGVVTLEVHR